MVSTGLGISTFPFVLEKFLELQEFPEMAKPSFSKHSLESVPSRMVQSRLGNKPSNPETDTMQRK